MRAACPIEALRTGGEGPLASIARRIGVVPASGPSHCGANTHRRDWVAHNADATSAGHVGAAGVDASDMTAASAGSASRQGISRKTREAKDGSGGDRH